MKSKSDVEMASLGLRKDITNKTVLRVNIMRVDQLKAVWLICADNAENSVRKRYHGIKGDVCYAG